MKDKELSREELRKLGEYLIICESGFHEGHGR